MGNVSSIEMMAVLGMSMAVLYKAPISFVFFAIIIFVDEIITRIFENREKKVI